MRTIPILGNAEPNIETAGLDSTGVNFRSGLFAILATLLTDAYLAYYQRTYDSNWLHATAGL
jgi:hypothetical protein